MSVVGAVDGSLPGDALLEACGAVGPLLPALFASPVVGVAVVDADMRFRAINETLAAMNGLPAPQHLGRKLRHVLGSAAAKIEVMMDQVLQTGEALSNVELTAELPARTGVGHWVESFFPVRDAAGRVRQVTAVVLEVAEKKSLERSLGYVIGKLLLVGTTLKTELQRRETKGAALHEPTTVLARAIELLEQCLGEAQKMSEAGRHYPLVNVPHLELSGAPKLAALAGTATEVIQRLNTGGRKRGRELSQREREVVRLLADCKSNKEVATALGISVRTAETHRAHIMMKLELHSVAQLVRYAMRNGIIEA
jgi:PAS domain S-box-containing protein